MVGALDVFRGSSSADSGAASACSVGEGIEDEDEEEAEAEAESASSGLGAMGWGCVSEGGIRGIEKSTGRVWMAPEGVELISLLGMGPLPGLLFTPSSGGRGACAARELPRAALWRAVSS